MINKCLLKVAHFDAQLEEYNLAIEHFEQVATDSIDNPLTKWSNKEYYLKAGLCSLCTNVWFLRLKKKNTNNEILLCVGHGQNP
jgi:hypothetical protein